MNVSTRITMAACIMWTAAQHGDCFIDLESENGNYAQKTDIAELMSSNTMVQTRNFGENSQISKQPDTSEQIEISPVVPIRHFQKIGNASPRSDVTERRQSHPVIRKRPVRPNSYISPQTDVAERNSYGQNVKNIEKQRRPSFILPEYKRRMHIVHANEKRHMSKKKKKSNRGIGITRSGHDIASRNDYKPTVHRSSANPFSYNFNIRLNFPWMTRKARRNHASQKYGQLNKFYKIFKKYLEKTLND